MTNLQPLRIAATSAKGWRTLALGILVGALSFPLFLH